MRVLVVLILAATLAGCADAGTASEPTDDFGEDLQATATTGVIRGVVVDISINPLPGANVTLVNQDKSTLTDESGFFGFQDLAPGPYFVAVERPGYGSIQQNVEVEAGVDKPAIVRILLEEDPSTAPYIVPLSWNGHLTCGVAVFVTSLGCTTLAVIADNIGDASIFYYDVEGEPEHIQGELYWTNTQALAGRFIWEIVGDENTHEGYREVEHSPALAYLNKTVIEERRDVILDDDGIAFRFFGGPMDGCEMPSNPPPPPPPPPFQRWSFGCGVTIDQSAEVYAHVFYNFSPDEGWRFTSDGDHAIPS